MRFRQRAFLLAVFAATASCRQIAGIQDLPQPCSDPLMIDDMEDGDPAICRSQGRQGGWFSFGDGSGGAQTLTPNAVIDGARGASRRAVHFTGGGFTSWGAITGFNLNDDGLGRNDYDAGGAGGLTFWMKSDVAVDVELPIPETVLIADSGSCDPAAQDGNCNDHFRFSITAPGDGWRQYKIPFTTLHQEGSAVWSPKQLIAVQFVVHTTAPFDIWIDDVAFYYCASTECAPTCTDPQRSVACAAGRQRAGCYPTGESCAAVDSWCVDPMLVDDMEDADEFACASSARKGKWRVLGDGSTPPARFAVDEIPGGRGSSHRAAHLSASGLTGWGAGLRITTIKPGSETYDASAVDGVRFWMKGTATALLGLPIPATIPVGASDLPAGTCTNGWDCGNSFFRRIQSDGDQWVEHRVPFASLRQDESGTATWDPSHLMAIEFDVPGQEFDVWIDDISFYSCGSDACLPTCDDPAFPVACAASAAYPTDCWPAGTDCAAPVELIYHNSVWGSGPNDVWISGIGVMSLRATTLHWDGATWSARTSADAPAIEGLWGIGPDDLWATGVRGTIQHWTGTDWSTVVSATTANLYGAIWGSASDDVWAAGASGTLVHWNGTAWSAVASGTTLPLLGLWGSGRDDVWTVGVAGTILHLTAPGWSVVTSGTTSHLQALWGSGPSDVWAVGSGGTILHWNGAAWTSILSGTTNQLHGLWGSGVNDVWAVGDAGTILRWDGSAWVSFSSNTTSALRSVWGSHADDVYIVGDLSTVLHWDGQTLSPVTMPGMP